MNFELKPPTHGGDLLAWQRQDDHAAHWLDLSSACNREPWPIPELDRKLWYELPDQYELEQSAAAYFGYEPIGIGAGTQQFIEILPPLLQAKGAGKSVMVPAIGYQEHSFCWRKWGYEVSEYHSIQELLDSDWHIAVVIQPNNPTAECLTESETQALRDKLSYQECFLVLDEAFLDAAPEYSWLNQTLLERCFILRSVGKFFGLAGARVGFLFGHESYKASVQGLLGPWPVATPSVHLLTQALNDRAWQMEAKESIAARHAFFIATIAPKLNTLFDSQTMHHTSLFYTWQLTEQQAHKAFQALHSVGVHIRLGQGWVRLSLPAGHEMLRLNAALVSLLQGHQLKELG